MGPLALLLACIVVVAAIPDENQAVSEDEYDEYLDMDKKQYHTVYRDIFDKMGVIRYEPVKCDRVMGELGTVMLESRCAELVEVYVNLTEDSSYSYRPTRVKVKRCGGMCKAKQACMSIGGKKERKIPVKRTNLSNNKEDCVYVVVEDDIKCSCSCIVQKQHCSEKQMYNTNACECECDDMVNKEGMCLMKGNVWIGEKCECRCREEDTECSTGYKWDPDMCMCVRRNRPRKMWTR